MKMTNLFLYLLSIPILLSCNNRSENNLLEKENIEASTAELIGKDTNVTEPICTTAEFNYDSDGIPTKKVFSDAKDKSKCFFVISKVHPEHLSVYESIGTDTFLLATYPVCIAKNKGQKERRGDNKTPESYPGDPFYIQQIQDASDWHHDFGDGRGPILAYGHWFLRLCTPGFSGIGIHGSTGNRESISEGRGSEGCIRLLDEDIIHLHDNYAIKGTKVIILQENMGPLPFEKKAMRALSNHVNSLSTIEENINLRAVSAEIEDFITPKEEFKPEAKKKDINLSSSKTNKKEIKRESNKLEVTKTWPDSVTVCGTRQMLRLGPTKEYEIYSDESNRAICPRNGETLPCIGEEGSYYKVMFNNKELFINKISCTNSNE